MHIFNGTIDGYDKNVELTLNMKSLSNDNEKVIVGYWKGTEEGHGGETISFYPNNTVCKDFNGGIRWNWMERNIQV